MLFIVEFKIKSISNKNQSFSKALFFEAKQHVKRNKV